MEDCISNKCTKKGLASRVLKKKSYHINKKKMSNVTDNWAKGINKDLKEKESSITYKITKKMLNSEMAGWLSLLSG